MAEVVGNVLRGAVVSATLTEVIILSKRAWRCKHDCDKLACTMDSARPHVEALKDLESKSSQEWLHQLMNLLDEAKNIIEKYCSYRPWWVPYFMKVTRVKLSSMILDINERIKSKVGEGKLLIQIYEEGSLNIYIPRVLPIDIVSFDNDPFQQLKSLIISKCDLEHPPITLGLIGCGGAGKTLVAQMLHNDDDIKAKYGKESILWVTVGRDANLLQFYKKMGMFLSISIDHEDLEDQLKFLMDAFQKWRVLLILDDVWDEDIGGRSLMEWINVAKGKGSVTLVTTQNGDVLRTAIAKQAISISLLSSEKSWKLFCSYAFGSDDPSSHEIEIGEIAKQVCEKCGGLPLALEVIGASMYGKGDVMRWKCALGKLSNIEGKDKLLEMFKYSYEELEKEEQKLFLYFAAFPEDYEISTTMLCSIWHADQRNMNHGGIESVHLEGMEKLLTLADRSLIKLSKDGESHHS